MPSKYSTNGANGSRAQEIVLDLRDLLDSKAVTLRRGRKTIVIGSVGLPGPAAGAV